MDEGSTLMMGLVSLLEENVELSLFLSFTARKSKEMAICKPEKKKKRLPPELHQLVPWSQTSQHPELGKINFCYLSSQSIVFC